MEKDRVSRDFALNMIRYYMQSIISHFGFIRTDLENLSTYASALYGALLHAYVNDNSKIVFRCTDPSSPKYTDKDLTLNDIL